MTSKGNAAASPSSQSSLECCMCGDYGFTHDLFLCKLCHFRSQHRYCSNLYPKSESYSICNWCLSQKEEPKEKSHHSSNSSSHYSNHHNRSKNDIHGRFKDNTSNFQSKFRRPIKKQQPPPESPSSSGRNRVADDDVILAQKQRRTKNEDQISKRNGVLKQVFRHKVRRYKLLDEVAR